MDKQHIFRIETPKAKDEIKKYKKEIKKHAHLMGASELDDEELLEGAIKIYCLETLKELQNKLDSIEVFASQCIERNFPDFNEDDIEGTSDSQSIAPYLGMVCCIANMGLNDIGEVFRYLREHAG